MQPQLQRLQKPQLLHVVPQGSFCHQRRCRLVPAAAPLWQSHTRSIQKATATVWDCAGITHYCSGTVLNATVFTASSAGFWRKLAWEFACTRCYASRPCLFRQAQVAILQHLAAVRHAVCELPLQPSGLLHPRSFIAWSFVHTLTDAGVPSAFLVHMFAAVAAVA